MYKYFIPKGNNNKEDFNMSQTDTRREKTKTLVLTSLFAAIIVILAFTPFIGFIPLGPIGRATTVHIPVIIGAILLGPKCGAFLGGVFGLTSLITNTINPSVLSFAFSPFYTLGAESGGIKSIIVCFVPRILIGVVSYYVYILLTKLFKGKCVTLSTVISGIAGSMTNTLLVMNLIYFFFKDSYASIKDVDVSAVYGIVISVIAINGIPEAIVAAIIAAAVVTAIKSKTQKAYK